MGNISASHKWSTSSKSYEVFRTHCRTNLVSTSSANIGKWIENSEYLPAVDFWGVLCPCFPPFQIEIVKITVMTKNIIRKRMTLFRLEKSVQDLILHSSEKLYHVRWLTIVNRVLRLNMTKSEPFKKLKTMVELIIWLDTRSNNVIYHKSNRSCIFDLIWLRILRSIYVRLYYCIFGAQYYKNWDAPVPYWQKLLCHAKGSYLCAKLVTESLQAAVRRHARHKFIHMRKF